MTAIRAEGPVSYRPNPPGAFPTTDRRRSKDCVREEGYVGPVVLRRDRGSTRLSAASASSPVRCSPERHARPNHEGGCLTASVKTVHAAAAPDEPLVAERGVSPVELLWDLVFVFAVTQVGTLLSRDLSWAGFGRSLLVLALVWWAWSAFVWVANAEDADAPAFLLTLLAALVLIFISGLAIPHAFGAQATLFAVTYAGVRFMHLSLYAHSARQGHASWEAIAGFSVTVTVGMMLL